jgi:hypothetical protein
MTQNNYDLFGLTHNPFEPSASGIPLMADNLWIPDRWKQPAITFLNTMQFSTGPKAFAIQGEYGSGKTYLLNWIERELLTSHRMVTFFFDNPGVQFYSLANSLLRKIGREEFAKSLWEYLHPELPGLQRSLFGETFYEWLRSVTRYKRQNEAVKTIADQVRIKGISNDEEIAYKLGRLIVETLDRPYFEYKDFIAGRSGSLVAEGEEAPYFAAILRILRLARGASNVAFLLDEFEEISLQKRLTTKQSYDYLATLKRLINLTERENFWIFAAMTPQAAEVTQKIEPALWQRFVNQGKHQLFIPPLNESEAIQLLMIRLANARPENYERDKLFPFPPDILEQLREDVKSSPRRLVKVCSIAIAEGISGGINTPFPNKFIQDIESKLYPISNTFIDE